MSDDRLKTGGGLDALGMQPARPDARDALLGRSLGPWTLISLIAEGGMGRVYRAERADGTFDRQVALKLLPRGLGPEYEKRFQLERRILADLQYPNIAQLHDAGSSEDGIPYLVMELVRGRPIDRFVDEEQLPTEAKVQLMLRLAETLAFAHARLVVHRDLKPSNVLVADDGTLKLLDFGIAKILEAPDHVTAGYRPMTPAYASPEQLLNEPVSVASDIYQCGRLFLTLFNPRPGLDAETPLAVVERARRQQSKRANDLLASPLPADLAAVINQCLRVEPSERYGSAAELAADLRAWLAGYPVAARQSGALGSGLKFLRRNRLTAIVTSVVLAAVTGATIWHTRSLAREQALAQAANERAQIEAATARATSDFLMEMIAGADALNSPDTPRTVRETVLHGARMIRTELADQPAVRVPLAMQFASVFNAMGRFEEARDVLTTTLQEVETNPAISLEQRLAMRTTLAYSWYRLSDFDSARSEFQNVINLCESNAVTGVEICTRARRRMALLERAAGNYETAVEIMARAEAEYRALVDDPLTLGRVIGDHGLILSHVDKEGALKKYAESIRLLELVQGADCTSCAITRFNMAWAYRELERYDEALAALMEADQIFRRQTGEDYGEREARVFFEIGSVYNDMGRYDEAIKAHQRALAIARAESGPQSALAGLALYNAAQTHRDHRRCDLALPLLYEARAIHCELFGEDGKWTTRTDDRIVQCEEAQAE